MEKNTAAVLAIGQIVTCQMGNASDTAGYEAAAQVEVVGTLVDWMDRVCYLVRKVNDHSFLAYAIPAPSYVEEAVLYSTNARRVGASYCPTVIDGVRSLGFFEKNAIVDFERLAA